jgi:hypothetical protein
MEIDSESDYVSSGYDSDECYKCYYEDSDYEDCYCTCRHRGKCEACNDDYGKVMNHEYTLKSRSLDGIYESSSTIKLKLKRLITILNSAKLNNLKVHPDNLIGRINYIISETTIDINNIDTKHRTSQKNSVLIDSLKTIEDKLQVYINESHCVDKNLKIILREVQKSRKIVEPNPEKRNNYDIYKSLKTIDGQLESIVFDIKIRDSNIDPSKLIDQLNPMVIEMEYNRKSIKYNLENKL